MTTFALPLPRSKRVLPGFGLTMGTTLLFLSIVILLPLSGLFVTSAGLGWEEFWRIVSGERAVASYKVTLSSAFIAAVANTLFGLLLAWILVRSEERRVGREGRSRV